MSFRDRGPVGDAVAGRGVAAEGVGWEAAAGEARGLRDAEEEDGGGRRRDRISERGGRGEKASGESGVVVDMVVMVGWEPRLKSDRVGDCAIAELSLDS